MKLLFSHFVLSLSFVFGEEIYSINDRKEEFKKPEGLQDSNKCFPRKLPCLSVVECSYEKIEEALEEKIKLKERCNNSAEGELKLWGINRQLVDQVCQKGLASCILPFDQITDEGPVFDKEYFDGGTYYNEARENDLTNEDKLEVDPGTVIENIYNNDAQNRLITWPSYIDNFEDCQYNAAMCCFVQDRQADDNNGDCESPYATNCVDADPGDNTDVCYVDMERAPTSSRTPAGFALFPLDGRNKATEGAAHCHGFAWSKNKWHPSSIFKGNNLFYVSMYDHFTQRGYVRNVPGSPMCGCVEKMSVVSRSDCTEIDGSFEYKICWNNGHFEVTCEAKVDFIACRGGEGRNNNDLEAYYKRLIQEGEIDDEFNKFQETVVGEGQCRDRTIEFLQEKMEEYSLYY